MGSSPELTPYELMVQRNIEANRQVLKSLGLLEPVKELKDNEQQRKPRKSSNPRQIIQDRETKTENPIPAKRTRRSASILKSLGYDEFEDAPNIYNNEENTPPIKKERVVREQLFGEIEGVNVGDWWLTRMECSSAGVHRPTVAGIHGKLGTGCYSIALSGGYEDDVDYGECFTYTGCGGRDLRGTKTNPKNLRTAPQSKDQVMDGTNAALASNIESKIPVRVIRGYKLQSKFAPQEGYRYDGLYSVEKCWIASGLSGFKVCKFALKRLPDQDPPPWKTHPSILSPEKERWQATPTRRTLIPKLELSCEQNLFEKTNISPKVVSTISNSAKDSEKKKTPTFSLSGCVKMANTLDGKRKGTKICSSDSKKIDKIDQENNIFSSSEDVKCAKESDNNKRVLRITRLSSEIVSEALSTSNRIEMNQNTLSEKKNKISKSMSDSEPTRSSTRESRNKETNGIPSSSRRLKVNNTSAKKSKENDNTTLETKVLELSNEGIKTEQNNGKMPKNKTGKSLTLSENTINVSGKKSNDFESHKDNDSEQEDRFLGFSEFQTTRQASKCNFCVEHIDVEDCIDCFQVDSIQVKEIQNDPLKPSNVKKSDQEINGCGTPLNSCVKKVQFSPEIRFTDDEGNVEFFVDCCNGESTDISIEKPADGKKQKSILNYFEPVKKPVEIQPAKPVVNAKSLRGNRFTSFSLVMSADVRPNLEKSNKKDKHQRIPERKTTPTDDFPKSSGYTPANRRKSWSRKRKYSSLDSNRESYLDIELNLSKKGPSMMENLIKQNNDKLRLHNQQKKKSKKGKISCLTTSPVKPCFVSLLRIEEIFSGWDMGHDSVFLGFNKHDIMAAQRRADSLIKVYKTIHDSQSSLKWLDPVPSTKDSFHGWDLNEDFRGARGLVPIGFIIDKLSES